MIVHGLIIEIGYQNQNYEFLKKWGTKHLN